jgi:hypothetical protein
MCEAELAALSLVKVIGNAPAEQAPLYISGFRHSPLASESSEVSPGEALIVHVT